MPEWNPSDTLFRNRLAYIINAEASRERVRMRAASGRQLTDAQVRRSQQIGLGRVADQYNRSRETVRRWLGAQDSRQQPRSAALRRSVANRGRRLSGPTVARRGAAGRFTTALVDARARRAIESINARRAELRATAVRTSTNPRQRRAAEMMGQPLTAEEEQDLDRRLRNLQRDDALGRPTSERWVQFRDDYRTMSGGRGG